MSNGNSDEIRTAAAEVEWANFLASMGDGCPEPTEAEIAAQEAWWAQNRPAWTAEDEAAAQRALDHEP